MGWELILCDFRRVNWEEEQQAAFNRFVGEDHPMVRLLDWQMENIEEWALVYFFENDVPLFCDDCGRYSMLCACPGVRH